MRFFTFNYHITIPAISIVAYILSVYFKLIDIKTLDKSTLVTIAIATEGFLFTSISIMLASSDKKFFKLLRQYGSMQKLEALILSGMIFSGFSVIAYLCTQASTCNFILFDHLIFGGVIVGTVCFISSCVELFKSFSIADKYDQGKYLHK